MSIRSLFSWLDFGQRILDPLPIINIIADGRLLLVENHTLASPNFMGNVLYLSIHFIKPRTYHIQKQWQVHFLFNALQYSGLTVSQGH